MTNMGFPCRECLDTTGGVALAVVTAIFAVFMVAVLTSYLMSGETVQGRRGGRIEFLARYIPLQSVKIVIATWQILVQVGGRNVTSDLVSTSCLDCFVRTLVAHMVAPMLES